MDGFALITALTRGLHVTAMLSLFGCLVFRRLVVPADAASGPAAAIATKIGLLSAGLALVFGVVWLTAVSATLAGADTTGATFEALPTVLGHTRFGNVLGLRLLLLAGALILLASRRPLASLAAAGVAISVQPLLGHIGALEDGTRWVLLPIEAAHLLAAGAWLGGLAPLMLSVARAPPKLAATLCERFTPVGLVAVGTIAVTALPQAGELIGGLPGLFGTPYGHFALLKLGLFCLALGLACVNRLVLTARLGSARGWLIGSVAIESVAAFCVVLAAAAMASSAPAAHTQPFWPFPWRPSLDAWQEPDSHAALLRLAGAGLAGMGLIVASLTLRRFRLLAIGLASVIVVPFTPALGSLLVEAWPTSYARSTTGFSVDAIMRGQALYGTLCASCHDQRDGRGGEADLLAPHIWGHLDGDLFWRISHGITDPEGNAVMPGFAEALSEDDRWALIDFIHARNVGRQMAATGHWSPPVPAPATPLRCTGGDASALADLAPRMLVVVADGATETITIRPARGATDPPETGECEAVAPTAWEAWRLLAGAAPGRFAGYEAIVDRQGWLRAWLPPGAGAARLEANIRYAAEHPITVAASAAGHHH